MNDRSINNVVAKGLCTGCGTCISMCPTEAIELKMDEKKGVYSPQINSNNCINCGICLEVCSGEFVNYYDLNIKIFGKTPTNILIGNYINCYAGYANDYDTRYNSSSGGLATALLIFALEEGIIDGALVTRMKKNNPLEAEPFIARTKEEIIEASKSKYCPVPLNIVIKEILNSVGDEKIAVVGLPCHIQGLRKAEEMDNKLKRKIAFRIGIMCSHTMNSNATEFILNNLMKLKKDEILSIQYRGNGWPGSFSVETTQGEKKYHPYTPGRHIQRYPPVGILHLLHFFTPDRCMMCSDQNCELSDISLGDAWLPEFKIKDSIGTSVIAIRTAAGQKLLEQAKLKGSIQIENMSVNKLIQSQADVLYFKKRTSNAIRKFYKNRPEVNLTLLRPNFKDYLLASIFYIHMRISSKRCLWRFIPYIILFEWSLGKLASHLKFKR